MVKKVSTFFGIPISPGIAWGRACIFGSAPKVTRRTIRFTQVAEELGRLSQAIEVSRVQLKEIRANITERIGHKEGAIFDAHLLFLNDPVFMAQIQKRLVEELINVEAAVEDVLQESILTFSSTQDSYLKERIQDIRDVGHRILDNLIGSSQQCLLEGMDLIIVATELTPSQTANINSNHIKGIVSEKGGLTSHAAILARSLGIPLVTGIPNLVSNVELSMPIFLNGNTGEVTINPSVKKLQSYKASIKEQREKKQREKKAVGLPSVTKDGHTINFLANIRSEEDIELARTFLASGIGLYRTEMHFIDRHDYPSEDEQYEHYRTVVEKMNPLPVTIRTMDLGGDKLTQFYKSDHRFSEHNPYLGLRAIRLSLQQPEIFKQQLRAILRAGVHGSAKILLPMIASIEEIKQVKILLNQSKKELQEEGKQHQCDMPIGAMIEIPSAALVIDAIYREVDFVSIGTNDLIQYTLAVDRGNAQVSKIYEPLHPSILILLKNLVFAAKRAGKEISICGEMAGDIKYTKLLIGLGYRNLSMSSYFIPQLKRYIRSITAQEAEALAEQALAMTEVKRIKKLLNI
ncbi:MAG: phosphoenolpyruvate--protein phosphotransferase [Candidatus Zhuqueibacterota bacterium]